MKNYEGDGMRDACAMRDGDAGYGPQETRITHLQSRSVRPLNRHDPVFDGEVG